MNHLQPVSGIGRNPMLWIKPSDMVRIPVGVTIASQAPDPEGDLLICVLNGEILMRPYWNEVTQPGDVILWRTYPQNREIVRVLLQIAIVASILITPLNFLTPWLIAANIAYNLLVPPRIANQTGPQQDAAGSIFSTSLAGNAARLDQPIWKVCGRVKITPPFAAMPYGLFRPRVATEPDGDADQYYYAVFAVGVGDHELERALIGKTSIKHFSDVIRAEYLAPGVAPTTVACNIVTSSEVSNIELDSQAYRGGYVACRPGDKVTSVSVDNGCSQGLGTAAGAELTVEWQTEAREINDFGSPLGDWQVLGLQTKTRNTNTPPRWTKDYTLIRPMRCEVRQLRTDTKSTDSGARHALQWIGLRATLERAAPLNVHTAHFEVVMRASEQLSSETQRDFSMILRAMCRTYEATGSPSGWQAPVHTRNAAWWMLELLSSPTWGLGVTDDRIDIASFVALAAVFDERQDRFDYAFTSSSDSWSALQLIAHSCRCRIFRRNGVYTVARDELVDLPVSAISPRIAVPDSMKLIAALPKLEQADGYIVQYLSNVTWDTAQEEAPCPGFSATDTASPFYNALLPAMSNPIYMQLEGVTGRTHARREGIYQAASLAYRQTTTEATVEMEGALICFMDAVRWQPQIHGYGQAGDVTSYDAVSLEVGLSEPADFSTPGARFITFVRDDGTLTDPVAVVQSTDARVIRLPAVPPLAIVSSDSTRERTKYLLGPADIDELIKVTAIRDGGRTDGGAQLFAIEGLVDDDRVHLADNALLPHGEIQDPIDDGAEADVDTTVPPGYSVQVFIGYHQYLDNSQLRNITWTLEVDGSISILVINTFDMSVVAAGTYAVGEWTNTAIDASIAAGFDVLFHNPGSSDPAGISVIGGAMDTWYNLGTARSVKVTTGGAGGDVITYNIDVSIRRAGSTIVQTVGRLNADLGFVSGLGS